MFLFWVGGREVGAGCVVCVDERKCVGVGSQKKESNVEKKRNRCFVIFVTAISCTTELEGRTADVGSSDGDLKTDFCQ